MALSIMRVVATKKNDIQPNVFKQNYILWNVINLIVFKPNDILYNVIQNDKQHTSLLIAALSTWTDRDSALCRCSECRGAIFGFSDICADDICAK
jgi:hypothetical protein